jgi:hypothetical protein
VQADIGGDMVGAQNDWRSSRRWSYGLSAGGSVFSTAGALLLGDLIPRRHRRWAAPVLAAVGSGLLATGVTLVTRGGACHPELYSQVSRCVEAQQTRDKGAIVALWAAPILSVSVLHLVQWLGDRHVPAGVVDQ